MIEADRADYNRAKLDHDLIVAITNRNSLPTPKSNLRLPPPSRPPPGPRCFTLRLHHTIVPKAKDAVKPQGIKARTRFSL